MTVVSVRITMAILVMKSNAASVLWKPSHATHSCTRIHGLGIGATNRARRTLSEFRWLRVPSTARRLVAA